LNLQQIREALPERLRAEIDVDLSWRLYCAAGGVDDEDAFVEWIAERYPHAFDPHRTVPVDTVEVSAVLPARLAGEATRSPRDAVAANDADADEEPTVIMMPSVAGRPDDDAATAGAASAASRELLPERAAKRCTRVRATCGSVRNVRSGATGSAC
jgi:hypothetical protein